MTRPPHSDEFGRTSPKTALRGSVHFAFKACGKSGCRCQRGELHGPYWRRWWRDAGERHTEYVRLADVPRVVAAIGRWHELHPPARSLRDELAELTRLSKASFR